jgi:hypothetical protein
VPAQEESALQGAESQATKALAELRRGQCITKFTVVVLRSLILHLTKKAGGNHSKATMIATLRGFAEVRDAIATGESAKEVAASAAVLEATDVGGGDFFRASNHDTAIADADGSEEEDEEMVQEAQKRASASAQKRLKISKAKVQRVAAAVDKAARKKTGVGSISESDNDDKDSDYDENEDDRGTTKSKKRRLQ